MRITKRQLRRIIKEEIASVVDEEVPQESREEHIDSLAHSIFIHLASDRIPPVIEKRKKDLAKDGHEPFTPEEMNQAWIKAAYQLMNPRKLR